MQRRWPIPLDFGSRSRWRWGELCVCDLAWISGHAENLVSHHLRRLRAAGLAGRRRDHKMVLYSLTPAGTALLATLVPDHQPAVLA